MNKLKIFLKTSITYFVGNVLSKLIGFFLLPLYTNKLAPDQFGSYDLSITVLAFVVPLVFIQIWDGLYRYGFEKESIKEKYCVVSNSYLVWFISLILFTIIYIIINNLFVIQDCFYIFLYGLSMAANYQYFYLARVFLKNNLFVISGLINSIIVASLNIVLITVFDLGVRSLYISSICGFVVQILIIEVFLHPIKSFKIKDVNKNSIIQMIKFTIPLSFTTISSMLLQGYTKISISTQLGTYSNGLYAVANRVSSIMTIFITIVQYAWNELAYIIASEVDSKHKYEVGISYIFKIAIIASSALMLVIKIAFPYFISDAYREALFIIPLTLIGITANAYANFLSILFLAEKQTKWLFLTTLFVAVINVTTQLVFTSTIGLQGFVTILCLSYTLLAGFRIFTVRRTLKINFFKLNYLYMAILLATVLIFYYIESLIIMVLFIVSLGLLLIYILRKLLKQMLNKKLSI